MSKPCVRCNVKPKRPGPGRKFCAECAEISKAETVLAQRKRMADRWRNMTPDEKSNEYKKKYAGEIMTPEKRAKRNAEKRRRRAEGLDPDKRIREPGTRIGRLAKKSREAKPRVRVPWEVRRAYMKADPNSQIKRVWPEWQDVVNHYAQKEAA